MYQEGRTLTPVGYRLSSHFMNSFEKLANKGGNQHDHF